MSESLPELAAVLRASPESDALVILGCLLDSLPIGVLVTSATADLKCKYANEVLRRRISTDKLPIEGRPLRDIWEAAEQNGVLQILHQVVTSGRPQHLRNFEYVGLLGASASLPGDTTTWDWEVYPLNDLNGEAANLLIVIMDTTEHTLVSPDLTSEERQTLASIRENASRILRILGVPADPTPRGHLATLTAREREVAQLVAEGLSNVEISRRVCRSPATVASHIANILDKLGFTSRTQIATWTLKEMLQQNAR